LTDFTLAAEPVLCSPAGRDERAVDEYDVRLPLQSLRRAAGRVAQSDLSQDAERALVSLRSFDRRVRGPRPCGLGPVARLPVTSDAWSMIASCSRGRSTPARSTGAIAVGRDRRWARRRGRGRSVLSIALVTAAALLAGLSVLAVVLPGVA